MGFDSYCKSILRGDPGVIEREKQHEFVRSICQIAIIMMAAFEPVLQKFPEIFMKAIRGEVDGLAHLIDVRFILERKS